MRNWLGLLAMAFTACTTPLSGPLPPTTTPQELHSRVGAFAQSTQEGRLATVKAQLEASGLAYTVEDFEGKRPPPARGYNVVVRTGPESGREILLTAHYDAVVLPEDKLVDGAIDNAGSVVALIETAKRVAGRTRHTVRLILTDQEELGLIGAKAWIAAHGVGNVGAVINADVNGNGQTLIYGLNNGPQSIFMIDALKAVCAERAVSCMDFPEYPPSDDQAFAAAGAPVISIAHQPKGEAEKLRAFLLNPPTALAPPDPASIPEVFTLIHTPNDALALVEPETLAQAADIFTALVMKLDAQLP